MEATDLSYYLENNDKVYVDVKVDHFSDGRIIPIAFVWEDDKRYVVDKVLNVCRAASTKAGGVSYVKKLVM